MPAPRIKSGGKACRGHPRLPCCEPAKTWMAGTSPAMTTQSYMRGYPHNNDSWSSFFGFAVFFVSTAAVGCTRSISSGASLAKRLTAGDTG
jgi:hypothetical protein